VSFAGSQSPNGSEHEGDSRGGFVGVTDGGGGEGAGGRCTLIVAI